MSPELAQIARTHLPEPGEVYWGKFPADPSGAHPTAPAMANGALSNGHDVLQGAALPEPARPGETVSDERAFRDTAAGGLRSLVVLIAIVVALVTVPELNLTSSEETPTFGPQVTGDARERPRETTSGTAREETRSTPKPAREQAEPARRRAKPAQNQKRPPAQTAASRPSAAPPRGPSAGPLELRWPRRAKATYYNVQVFRDAKKIFEAWPAEARVTLPPRWTYGGVRHTLTADAYQWFVWPGFGSLSEARYGKLLKRGSFVVPEPA